ncbi:MAG: glycosyltransferase family 39 protein [Bacteroidales bacterium]|nr:glycosyltransferase family 39 protein [Bacteroidales bacterium]
MPARISNKQRQWLECLLLLALAVLLRGLFIGKTDLGRDESFSLYAAQLSLSDIVKVLCQGDNPPLWELLLHGWIRIFGVSETAIRSLSLIFSALTVIPIYFIGEKHIRRFAGIAAALCYCCSTFSIYLSHECRVYSLLGFAAACSAWLFISMINEPKTFKFILLTLVNLTLMYGHYLSVWIIVMEFLIVFLVHPIRQKIWKPYLIHALALILLFAPMFPVLLTRFLDSGVHGTWIEKSTGVENLYDFLWRMCNVPVTTVIVLVIMLSALVQWIVMVVRKAYHFGTGTILTLLWAVPLVASFLLSFLTGFMLDRYFYFLFPLFYLAIEGYCATLFAKRQPWCLGLLALVPVMMAVSCSPDSSTKRFSGWHIPVKPIVKELVEAKDHDNTLVILPEFIDKQFAYYLDDDHATFRANRKPVTDYSFQEDLSRKGYYYDCNYREADLSRYSAVAFPYHKAMPLEEIQRYLEAQGFQFMKETDAHPYAVRYYSAPPSSLP